MRDVTVLAGDAEHIEHDRRGRARRWPASRSSNVSDRTFLMHLGGKIEVALKAPLKTRDDLSMAYTPGVARVSSAIADDPDKVWNLTIKQNTVAVVTDGTAVLGLGDIGPEAALPVMEGKAMLFKEFAGVDAFPICLATKDVDEIVAVVKAIAPVFGGINLEDISAPRCFEIEDRLRDELDIPVFHDDQHGTAIVALAALINALKVVGKRLEEIQVVVTGVGAAGVAVTKMLLAAGVRDIVGCDREGAVYARTAGSRTGQGRVRRRSPTRAASAGTADEALAGADVFIGCLAAGRGHRRGRPLDGRRRDRLRDGQPDARGACPRRSRAIAAVIGTGRSDYPNQINNVLAFPGVFRGALDVRATRDQRGDEARGRARRSRPS